MREAPDFWQLPFSRRHGPRYELEDPVVTLTLADLFRADPLLEGKIEAESESSCWFWTGATQRSGSNHRAVYGRVCRSSERWLVHRWVYHLMVGRIPEGHDVHHRCEQTLCCNPSHLEDIEKSQHEWLHKEMAGYEAA